MKDFKMKMLQAVLFLPNFNEKSIDYGRKNFNKVTSVITEPPKITKVMIPMVQNNVVDMN